MTLICNRTDCNKQIYIIKYPTKGLCETLETKTLFGDDLMCNPRISSYKYGPHGFKRKRNCSF